MATLQERIDRGDVILLDGAMGTELQRRGVPMSRVCWSGAALSTHPDIVREVHEDYIRAGADIITTNTFSTARHVLELAGMGDKVREFNLRAVALAMDARDKAREVRPVSIAGSISSTSPVDDQLSMPSDERVEAGYREQAELLAEGGADLILLEMMADIKYASFAVRAGVATGLPTWVGFSCEMSPDGSTVMLLDGKETLSRALELVMPLGGSLVAVMHTLTPDTGPSLSVTMKSWPAAVGAYPHSGGWEPPNWRYDGIITPLDYLAEARRWVEMGAQVVGGCCGIGPDHIRLLREELPAQVPKP